MPGRKSDLIQVGVKKVRERGLKRKKDIFTRKGRDCDLGYDRMWEKNACGVSLLVDDEDL